MIIDVTKAKYLGDYRIRLTFENGVEGELDFLDFLSFKGVFEPLRDLKFFAQVGVNPDWGTICWPNGADFAPETLYARVTGTYESLIRYGAELADA